MRLSFGFVPVSGDAWASRLEAAGFTDVRRADLTPQVTGTLCPLVLERLASPTPQTRAVPASVRRLMWLLNRVSDAAVRRGRLHYELISACRPEC